MAIVCFNERVGQWTKENVQLLNERDNASLFREIHSSRMLVAELHVADGRGKIWA